MSFSSSTSISSPKMRYSWTDRTSERVWEETELEGLLRPKRRHPPTPLSLSSAILGLEKGRTSSEVWVLKTSTAFSCELQKRRTVSVSLMPWNRNTNQMSCPILSSPTPISERLDSPFWEAIVSIPLLSARSKKRCRGDFIRLGDGSLVTG